MVAFQHQKQIGGNDYAALPILYLYRHCFELYLKALVYHAALQSMNKSELVDALPRLWKEHSLLELTKMSRPVFIQPFDLTYEGGPWEQVTELAHKLDAVDRRSDSFRYPVSTKGDAALPEHFLTNIFVFSLAMEEVLDHLSDMCRPFENQDLDAPEQMKLALHSGKSRVP